MKPIRWRDPAAPISLSLALLLAVSGCDSGGPRTGETERAARAATATTRAASAIAAAQLPTVDAKSAATPEAATQAHGVAAANPSEQGDDALITAKVITGLAIDRTLRRSHIEVATRAGVVTLKGPAPSPAARSRAEEIARNVQGVTTVENRLSVQPG